ncbi:MAG: alpha/beta hydrolase [Cyanobacteria bacterium P01_H01_bin.121]
MVNLKSAINPLAQAVGCLVVGSALLTATAGEAAERINFSSDYETVSIDLLKEFAETGDPGDTYMKRILIDYGWTASEAQSIMNQEVSYSVIAADKLLSSEAGQAFLSDAITCIVPSTGVSDSAAKAAMSSAILTSLSDDGTLSPIELLENYPVDAHVLSIATERDFLHEGGAYTGADAGFACTGLVTSFLQSSEAQQMAQQVEAQFAVSQSTNRTVTLPPRTTTTVAPAPAPAPAAPVRALW